MSLNERKKKTHRKRIRKEQQGERSKWLGERKIESHWESDWANEAGEPINLLALVWMRMRINEIFRIIEPIVMNFRFLSSVDGCVAAGKVPLNVTKIQCRS